MTVASDAIAMHLRLQLLPLAHGASTIFSTIADCDDANAQSKSICHKILARLQNYARTEWAGTSGSTA